MMDLSRPWMLLLLLPWTVLVAVAMPMQLRALSWIEARSVPERRGALTALNRGGLFFELLLIWLVGVFAIFAASGPGSRGEGATRRAKSSVILLMDASLSMTTPDALSMKNPTADPISRIAAARLFASQLVEALPENRIALISFAGEAVIHMPPTDDHHALLTVLNSLRTHNYEKSSGTRFSRAFDAVAHLLRREEEGLQIVLLSDGELSLKDDFGDGIAVMARRGIPIHCIGIGRDTATGMQVYNLDDVRNRVEKPRVVAKFQSRRQLKNLRKMASATGGLLIPAENLERMPKLISRLKQPVEGAAMKGPGRRSLAFIFMSLALLLLVIESWRISRRGRKLSPSNPWRSIAVLLLMSSAVISGTGCRLAPVRAHRLNERGLALEKAGNRRIAEGYFESSAAWAFREEIPVYNLARCRAEDEDWAGAHDEFQRAIRLKPRMAEALFNDGRVLFSWGEEEFEPSSCEFERVREKWEASLQRFRQASASASLFAFKLRKAARENARAVSEALEQLKKLEEECRKQNSGSGGGGGGAGEEGGGGASGAEGGGGSGAGQSEGGGGSAGSQAEGGGGSSGGGSLTEEEKEQLSKELSRIRKESESAGDYSQSEKNRIGAKGEKGRKKGEGGGSPIYW